MANDTENSRKEMLLREIRKKNIVINGIKASDSNSIELTIERFCEQLAVPLQPYDLCKAYT